MDVNSFKIEADILQFNFIFMVSFQSNVLEYRAINCFTVQICIVFIKYIHTDRRTVNTQDARSLVNCVIYSICGYYSCFALVMSYHNMQMHNVPFFLLSETISFLA